MENLESKIRTFATFLMAIAFNLACAYLLVGGAVEKWADTKLNGALPEPTPAAAVSEPVSPATEASAPVVAPASQIAQPAPAELPKEEPKKQIVRKVRSNRQASGADQASAVTKIKKDLEGTETSDLRTSSDRISGVESDDSETEAQAPQAHPAAPEPKEVREIAEPMEEASAAPESLESNETQAAAVELRSYLELKQAPGNTEPKYPFGARQLGQEGSVELTYFVTESGEVKNLKVLKSSGVPELDQEAVRAVSHYHYSPGQSGWIKHPVQFSLKQSAS